jgi:hypothetical protein
MAGIFSDRHCMSHQDVYLQKELETSNVLALNVSSPMSPAMFGTVFVVTGNYVRSPLANPQTNRIVWKKTCNFLSDSKYLEVPYRPSNFSPKSHLTTDSIFPSRRQESQDYDWYSTTTTHGQVKNIRAQLQYRVAKARSLDWNPGVIFPVHREE